MSREEPTRLDKVLADDEAIERARSGDVDSRLADDLRRWVSGE